MKRLFVIAMVCFGTRSFSAPELPNICYDKLEGGQFCTTDGLGWVQVYIYNAGWCGPCNDEMRELSMLFDEFSIQPVVFVSMSGEGFGHGTKPDVKFMGEWQQKHKIPFIVASKYRDFGKAFNSPGTIPFAVILKKDGTVAKSGSLSAQEITGTVRALVENWFN